MSDRKAEKRAGELFDQGFHCAEAASAALVETHSTCKQTRIIPMATYFGAGIGCSTQDTCGAINGAVLALGCLLGRERSDAEWKGIGQLAVKLRERFIAEYGTTNCAQLRMQFGEPHLDKCRQVTCTATRIMSELIEKSGLREPCAA
jgi:C_GCAxxG_C_C family probable redox protein